MRAMLVKTFGFLALAVSLAACVSTEQVSRTELLANQDGLAPGASSSRTGIMGLFSGRSGDKRRLGDDALMNETPVSRDLIKVSDQGAITLNLVDVPLEQAAKAVLGDALKMNYAIKPGVEGRMTLQTSRPMSEKDLLATFQTILELNGATLEKTDDLVTVIPLDSATPRISPVGEAGTTGARVVAVPLQYIGATEMTRLLQPMLGESVGIQPMPKRNVLLISGTKGEVNAALDAVNLFDVDVLKGKSVALVKLRAAEPEAVVEQLDTIFDAGEGGDLQNVVSFVPSKQLGAVLIVSSRSSYLTQAEQWVRDLDRTAGGAKRRPVVYSLQNRSAAELAPILDEMLQQSAGEAGGPIEGSPKVLADDTKNAVIVWGNDSEQEELSRLIQSLDTVPVQVLLEATIAEVALNDELNFGLRWFFEKGNGRGTFTDASSGSTGATFPGLSLVFQGASAGAAINALNSITTVNVVSSPSLMVLDNQEAKLQIGDEVPIATQQVVDTASADSPVVNTISFRDTGIILSVKPRVSRGGQVVLDISQEVSSVSATTTSGIDSPTISQRKIETSVVVQDGQTIALGGLIEEKKNLTNGQVPGLGDVPVVGSLFRNRKDLRGKTELLVLITPKVVRNGAEARAITSELRQRIGSAEGIVRAGIATPSLGHRIID